MNYVNVNCEITSSTQYIFK